MTKPDIEITGGIVTAESYSDASGTWPVFDTIGK